MNKQMNKQMNKRPIVNTNTDRMRSKKVEVIKLIHAHKGDWKFDKMWNSNKDVMIALAHYRGLDIYALLTDSPLKLDRDILISVINSCHPIRSLVGHPEYCDDREIALLAVKLTQSSLSSLSYLSARLQLDFGVVLAYIEMDAIDIHNVSPKLLDDMDFALCLCEISTSIRFPKSTQVFPITFYFLSARLKRHVGLQTLLLSSYTPILIEYESKIMAKKDRMYGLCPRGYRIADAIVCLRLR